MATGHINQSNVNHPNSECTTLTYSIKNIETLEKATELQEKLDDLHDEDAVVNLEISDYNYEGESISMKYKVKTCDNPADAAKIKLKLDQYLKKIGGQTTLDAMIPEDEAED